ncbi:MAG TPA: hypothetical protein PKB15_00050 [Acidimicrobiia bacterium]|jgi:8-oxo-dGTP pyrophosphatase MutT (NUDIX family)|nr:hypothetical protein [Acidimicrobiia bacterium]
MDISDLHKLPLARIKVRGLVKCGDEYIFIQRCRYGRHKKYLVFPGGRVKKSDRPRNDKTNLLTTFKTALERELYEELAATGVEIGELLGISKHYKHDREVLFHVDISSFDWKARTGKEFSNPNKGTFEIVKVKSLTKETLGKKGYHLKPKEWRKMMYTLDV